MSIIEQKICAWSGLLAVAMFFIAFVFAGYVPPPSPSLSISEVTNYYTENQGHIRLGMIIMMISGMFIYPFVAVISVYLQKIESTTPLMAYTQLSAGTGGSLFFIIPAVFFLVTAFRPDRNPELTYMLNDLSWITLVIVWPPACMQNIAIGVAVLKDKSSNPIFPRWFGYFNFWVALLFVPGCLAAVLKSGPFAWNGILAFWLPAFDFGIWFIVTFWLLIKAINRNSQNISK